MFVTPAYAQAAGGAGGGSFITSMIPLILIFVIFYFLLIRPLQKRAKEHKNMVENLRRGDQVVTGGGIVGKVTNAKDDDKVEIEIAKDVKVWAYRSTIQQVVSKSEPAKDS